jgi:hypothetical protein
MGITVDGFVIISPQSVAGFVKFTLSLSLSKNYADAYILILQCSADLTKVTCACMGSVFQRKRHMQEANIIHKGLIKTGC